jgi:probable addiction module antidote protein
MKMNVKEEFRPYDVTDYLDTPEDMAGYLDACLSEDQGDGALVLKALGNIARAHGMTQISRDMGIDMDSLSKALSNEGNPDLATIMKVIKALGLKLHAST